MINEGTGESQASWKERRKQQLRDEFVAIASRLFTAKGIEATSVEDIVSAAGVAKGTFYLYFKSKADVVGAVMDSVLSGLEAKVADAVAGSPVDARVTLKAIIRAQLEFLQENPGLVPLLFGGSLTADVGAEVRARAVGVTTAPYERVIRTGMLQTHYREVDARLAARVLQGIVVTLLSDAADAGEPFVGVESAALDFFERGIRRGA